MQQTAQKGVISPALIIGGIIVLVIIFFAATGNFKFSATRDADQATTQESQPETSSAPKSYQSDQYGFNLEYPGNWSYKETSGQFVASFFSPEESSSDKYREFLGVKVVYLSQQPDISLQEATDLWEEQTAAESQEDDFQVVNRQSLTISGLEAREIVFTLNVENIPAKGFVRIVLANGNAYIFQYFAEIDKYDTYLPDIEGILSSVSL